MKDLLNKVSQDNAWDDFSDVVYNCENRRTIMQIVEEAIEITKIPQPHPKVLELTKKLEVIHEIISYDDRDEDEKIREIVKLFEDE